MNEHSIGVSGRAFEKLARMFYVSCSGLVCHSRSRSESKAHLCFSLGCCSRRVTSLCHQKLPERHCVSVTKAGAQSVNQRTCRYPDAVREFPSVPQLTLNHPKPDISNQS